MVLLYSVRFSRRVVTRPGSGGRAASALAISRSTKPVSSAICFAVGRGSSSSGGMSPSRSLRTTISQRSASLVRASSES